MSKSKPQSGQSANPISDPLSTGTLLTAPKRRKGSKGGPLLAIVAMAVVFVLAAGAIVWLWTIKGRSSLAADVGTVAVDPDPPISAPPVKDLVKPTTNDFAGRMSLDKSLEMLLGAASAAPDSDSQFVANQRIPRWEIRFPNGNTAESYARQLDSLGIELGVIGGSERIIYGSSFTKEKPERREGPAADEQRFYMTWRSGALRDLDNALLSRAKIETTDRIVAQFYPPQLERTLADLEKQFADKHDLAEVRHTVFAVSPLDKGYEFRVVEQEYVSGEVKNASAKSAKNAKEPPAKAKTP